MVETPLSLFFPTVSLCVLPCIQHQIFYGLSDSGLELSSPPGPEVEGIRTPPLDWSLKARARFTSRHSFGWTQVEAAAL